MRRIVFAAALLLIASALPSHAQNQRKFAPAGFCTNSSLGSAVGLSTFTGTACNGVTNNTLAAYTYVVICAYTSGIVYRDDGTAPTGTPGTGGQGLSAGQCVGYSGNIAALQFIQQAAGAIVGVSVYN